MDTSVNPATKPTSAHGNTGGLHCTHCGQQAPMGAKFCSSCGRLSEADAPQQEETAFAEMGGDTPGLEPLRLRHAIGYYLVALGVTVLVFMTLPGLTFIVYLCCGFVMTRVVMRRLVEWHPVYNTLQTVTSAKLGMFALWPIQMLSLLFKLGVNKAF